MSSSINNSDHLYQLDNILKDFIKEKLEILMKEELNNFLQVERPDLQDSKNGYYQRSLDTHYGKVENLAVPRDRMGEFQTQLFEPYKRRDGWLEEAIIKMYQSDMSTSEIGNFVERILGSTYSPTTISNITDVALEDIHKWHQRALNKRYSVLYLDGMYIKLRRDVVGKEVIYFALGVTEDGYREILGFYVGGQESALGWREMLQDLYTRGVQEVLLGGFDGLPDLEEAFKSVYPKADVQRCVIHKVRNTLNHVRKKDQFEIAEDLKAVYKSFTKEAAYSQFESFKGKWSKKYPKEIQSWEKGSTCAVNFFGLPLSHT